jgi:N-hydroxyarylamine O-acetyltransferase
VDNSQVAAYLDRIGASRPAGMGAASLAELQRRHLFAVPFENLSIHLGEPIVLEEDALFDKLVRRRRGGFCYELNGAFAALLSALGFPVTLLAARVYGADRLGPLFGHLALRLDLAEPWLVDVGFGRFSTCPLRLDEAGDQPDREGTLRITRAESGDLDVSLDGAPQYRIEPRPRTLTDFEPTCWWHQTSPRSHFTQSTVCTLPTERGRITLSGRTLIESAGGIRSERLLASDAEVLTAYQTYFGIALERVPPTQPEDSG